MDVSFYIFQYSHQQRSPCIRQTSKNTTTLTSFIDTSISICITNVSSNSKTNITKGNLGIHMSSPPSGCLVSFFLAFLESVLV